MTSESTHCSCCGWRVVSLACLAVCGNREKQQQRENNRLHGLHYLSFQDQQRSLLYCCSSHSLSLSRTPASLCSSNTNTRTWDLASSIVSEPRARPFQMLSHSPAVCVLPFSLSLPFCLCLFPISVSLSLARWGKLCDQDTNGHIPAGGGDAIGIQQIQRRGWRSNVTSGRGGGGYPLMISCSSPSTTTLLAMSTSGVLNTPNADAW